MNTSNWNIYIQSDWCNDDASHIHSKITVSQQIAAENIPLCFGLQIAHKSKIKANILIATVLASQPWNLIKKIKQIENQYVFCEILEPFSGKGFNSLAIELK